MDVKNIAVSLFIGLAAETHEDSAAITMTLEMNQNQAEDVDNCSTDEGMSINYEGQE